MKVNSYEILYEFGLSEKVKGLLEDQARKTSKEVLQNVEWLLDDCTWRNQDVTQIIDEFKNRLKEVSWEIRKPGHAAKEYPFY
jgi:hypothetical protein